MPVTTPVHALHFPPDSEIRLDCSTRPFDLTGSTNTSTEHTQPYSKRSLLLSHHSPLTLCSNSILKKSSYSFQSLLLLTKEIFSQLQALSHRLPLSCFVRKSLPSTLQDRILHSILLGSILDRGCVCLRRDTDKSQLGGCCLKASLPLAAGCLGLPATRLFSLSSPAAQHQHLL